MAQRGINKVILVGNLGQEPEIKTFPNGGAVTNLSLATSETWKDKNTGQQQEKTEWHRIAIFGKLAEIAAQYLNKGSKVYIEGKLQTRKWQDQQGQDRYSTEVVVDGFSGQMQMLDSRGGDQGGFQPQQQAAPQAQQAPYQQAPQAAAAQNFNQAPAQPQGGGFQQGQQQAPQQGSAPQAGPQSFDNFDDDIPF